MPTLYKLDTRGTVPATQFTFRLDFPRPFVARPRLPHGFCELDISNNDNIRAKSTMQYFTKDWADWHVTTWGSTTLHRAIDNVFALAPANLEFLTGERMRNLLVEPNDPASVRVKFLRPFVTPPKVVVFFNHIDLDKNRNFRLYTSAADIDVNGFTLNIGTWSDTTLYAAQACWIAYPEDQEHIFSTSGTNDLRPWDHPQLQQSKAIEFDGIEFLKDPTVFVALNSIDIGSQANLRIRAYVDGVSKTGLTWHIDSWAHTVLYAAGASIIAFN